MSKKLSTQEKARRLWVRALRSGKYDWGKKKLNPSEGKFCCLGILCEVAIKHGIIASYEPKEKTPPKEVRDWVGLRTKDGLYGVWDSLTSENDNTSRNPFKKIANLIERKPAGLFVKEQD